MDLKSTYNHIAQLWHQDHEKDTWWIEGTDKFISLLPKGGTVLDVGCGSGQKARYMLSKGLKVTGIDFAEKMVELAEREAPGGKYQVLDLYQLNTIQEQFNGVFANAVLLHVKKDRVQTTIQSFADRLKAGGYLYVAVRETRIDRPDEAVLEEDDYGFVYERFFSYFTMDEIKKSLEQAGLVVAYKNIAESGKSRWLQLIGKK